MVIRKIPIYNFWDLDLKPITNCDFLQSSFYISLPILPEKIDSEKVLFEIPGSLTIRVINRSYNDESADNRSIVREGCFYYNEQNEWILEAICHMQTDDSQLKHNLTIRLPFSAPFVKDTRIGIYYDGTWVRFLKDGEVLNQDSGVDGFRPPEGELFIDETFKDVTASVVNNVTIDYKELKTNADAGFFFPSGWNTNIGDVMSFTHDGVYHLIYLLDRRHHGSGPCGSHYICQLTSENLIDWYEQKPIVEIDKPWKSYGTGMMFFKDGKYYMTYGLHTERYGNSKDKITPYYNQEKGEFEPIALDEILNKGGLPAGATYSVSDDGINFTPSNLFFHAARNPSAYSDENGKITLYCGYGGNGVFEADDMEKPFKKSDTQFNFISPLMKNSSECPAFFNWNGYKYLIIGFSGYFRTLEKNSDSFVDAAALGEDIYDGLSVPMVAEFNDNRRLIAGWVRSPLGWGGVLMQRELVQEQGGKLGMKWIPELIPKTNNNNLAEGIDILDKKIKLENGKSYLFEANVDSLNSEKLAISLDDNNSACNIELDFVKQTIQVNDAEVNCFSKPIPVTAEAMKNADEKAEHIFNAGITDIPQFAKNYAISDGCKAGDMFTLRLLVRYSKKQRCTVLDAEIAGRKTLISVRNGFFPTRLSALKIGNLTVKNVKLFTFEFEE